MASLTTSTMDRFRWSEDDQTLKKWLRKNPPPRLWPGCKKRSTASSTSTTRIHRTRRGSEFPMQAWRALDKATVELDGQPFLPTPRSAKTAST